MKGGFSTIPYQKDYSQTIPYKRPLSTIVRIRKAIGRHLTMEGIKADFQEWLSELLNYNLYHVVIHIKSNTINAIGPKDYG